MNFFFIILVIGICLLELGAFYEVKVEEKGMHKGNDLEKKNYSFDLDFEDDKIFIYEKDKVKEYDFEKRKLRIYIPKQKEYLEHDLVSILARRESIFTNILGINHIVEKKELSEGIKNNLVLYEHLYGLDYKTKMERRLELQSSGAENIFYFNDKLRLFSYKSRDFLDKISGIDNFYFYVFPVHSLIKNRIIKSGKIPLSFIIYQYDENYEFEKHVKISKNRANDKRITLDNYSSYKRIFVESEYKKILDMHGSGFLVKNLQSKKDFVVDEVLTLAKTNNYFDAYLRYIEYAIMTGEKFPISINRIVTKFDSDENIIILADLILSIEDSKNKKKNFEFIKQISKLADISESVPYIVHYYEALYYAKSKDMKNAKKKLLSALNGNPFLCTAWKYLGDLYFSEFDMLRAWECWEMAQKIAPKHNSLNKVYEYEKYISENFFN